MAEAQQTIDFDVVIAGAGFAGLAAADRINAINVTRASVGRSPIRFVVLEGAGRAGGRTITLHPELGYLDLGGQYLCPRRMTPAPQTAAYALVDRFNIELFNTHLPSQVPNVYESATGDRQPFEGNYPGATDAAVLALVAKIEETVAAMRHYVGRPWMFPDAAALDSLSVADWIQAEIPDPFMTELFGIAIRSAFSVEPREVSLLHFLHYAASCGSFSAFEHVEGGGDAVRFRHGTGRLVDELSRAVGIDKIYLGHKVVEIAQDAESCSVRTLIGKDVRLFRTRRVIMAMSPSAAARIEYAPALPAARQTMMSGMPMARTIKGFAVFRTPWWREMFSGYALSARGPAAWIMDNTWEDTEGRLFYPALMTFIVGDKAKEWSNQESTHALRKAAILEQLSTLFEKPRSFVEDELVKYVDFDWGSDPWGRGCPAGCFGKNVLTQLVDGRAVGETLYQAHGRIHWGGAESGLVWMGGYMNGALDSGIRVADEVAASIQ